MPSMLVMILRRISLSQVQEDPAIVAEDEADARPPGGVAGALPVEFQCRARPPGGDLDMDELDAAQVSLRTLCSIRSTSCWQ